MAPTVRTPTRVTIREDPRVEGDTVAGDPTHCSLDGGRLPGAASRPRTGRPTFRCRQSGRLPRETRARFCCHWGWLQRRRERDRTTFQETRWAVTPGFTRGHWSSPADPISCRALPPQILLKVGWAIAQQRSGMSCGEAEIRSRFLTTHDDADRSKGRRSHAGPSETRGSRIENTGDDSVAS